MELGAGSSVERRRIRRRTQAGRDGSGSSVGPRRDRGHGVSCVINADKAVPETRRANRDDFAREPARAVEQAVERTLDRVQKVFGIELRGAIGRHPERRCPRDDLADPHPALGP